MKVHEVVNMQCSKLEKKGLAERKFQTIPTRHIACSVIGLGWEIVVATHSQLYWADRYLYVPKFVYLISKFWDL